MANVFVYGTLKRGQPNHNVLLDGTNGFATFQGQGHTVEPYPLVIAGEHNIPHLLNLPGHGHCVVGEIYSVDEQMLHFLDEFEGCPDTYQRTQGQGPHSHPIIRVYSLSRSLPCPKMSKLGRKLGQFIQQISARLEALNVARHCSVLKEVQTSPADD
ncbi:gamma-glutamylaminecyclotransferase isoform X1 [Sturnira hondurensis]|uniref:gamma-glutamylaminecyclotransferase isoform X1 n=1 Tax=Sturnira hondurensis TaxID=192404 RepID=UPI00187AF683|nr:gamma-glutamylaminecyclotransferase isoform X1 [Sturnira hondurensis]